MKNYLQVAEELASRVARESDRIDRERKIPAELVQALADKNFFRLLVPRSLDGEEMDWLEYLRIIELFAEADASTAWCLNQNNVFATYAAKMPEQTAKEIWSDPRAVVANGPPASAFANPVEGGYLLSGRWNFSSGSPHATWFAAIAPVVSPEAEPHAQPGKENEVRILLVPKDEVEFIDDWQVAGLRGTGSLSFKADQLFVPYPRTFDPGENAREPGALYVISINLLFASGFATTALGAARSALDTAIGLAARKKQWMEKDRLQEKSTSHRMVGQGEACWRSARAFLREHVSAVWNSASRNHSLTIEERIGLRLSATHAIRMAAEVVDTAYALCGSDAIFTRNPIQRRFQDVHAITQQIQGRLSHYDTAGQFYLGLEPQGIF